MGDQATKSIAQGQSNANDTRGELGKAFWKDAVQGVTRPMIDPRVPGKPADPSAMLPWVDDDHHADASSDPRFWGDELRQAEFERRRKQDAAMNAISSRHSSELEGFPATVEIDEQVVGSTHRIVVARPRIANDLTALVTPSIVSVLGGTAHGFTPRVQVPGFIMLTKDGDNEIAVQFEPQQSGPVRADLLLDIRWTDGTADLRTIALIASARERTEIPAREVPVSPNAQFREAADFGSVLDKDSPKPPAPSSKKQAQSTTEFNELVRDTLQAAESLNDRQVDGVYTASEEAQSYTRKPPETGLFYDLMELAISMGVAGVAGIIGRQLGKHLAARLGRDDKSGLAIGLTDGIKEGLKRIGNSATVRSNTVEQLPGGPEHRREDEAIHVESPQPSSTNGRIAFFADQVSMLRDLVDENHALVVEQSKRLRPLLETNPDQALAAIQALNQAFLDVRKDQAATIQATESTTQWVAAVARSSLGSETAATPDRSYQREVSSMGNYGELTDGVVTIDVERNGNEAVVRNASIRGISQEVADRLADRPLVNAPVPVRLRVSNGSNTPTAVINLDEAKRFRVYGFLDEDDALPFSEYVRGQNMPEQLEAQATARAEKIVASVLARSLKQWGVEISSDDKSGRGDPK